MACGSQREPAVPGVCPNDGGGVAVANVDAGAGSLWLAGKIGWLAFQASSQVDEPQPVDGVADCVVLECGLRPAVRRAGGGVHVADDDRTLAHRVCKQNMFVQCNCVCAFWMWQCGCVCLFVLCLFVRLFVCVYSEQSRQQ